MGEAMLGLKREEITRRLSETSDAISAEEEKIVDLQKKESAVSKDILAAKKKVDVLRRETKMLNEALVIEGGIPENAARLREEIIEAVRQVTRDDILVKTREELQKKIKDLQNELRKICPHPFVVTLESSHIDREENVRVPGYRICVVCGYGEHSTKTVETSFLHTEDIYLSLNREDGRLERWRAAAGWQPETYIWQPLDELVEKYFIGNILKDNKLKGLIECVK